MGNGSAMGVCPVGFAFNTLEKVLEEAKRTAEPHVRYSLYATCISEELSSSSAVSM